MTGTYRPAPQPLSLAAQVLSETGRSRVSRVVIPDVAGTFIRKEALGPGAVERARHQIRILRRLSEVDGVTRQAAVHATDDLLFEDLPGDTLASALDKSAMDVPEFLDFAIELTRIVGMVHRAGVVHRDINPANILVTDHGHRPVLIDFDLATTFVSEHPAFTHHRELVGTLPYLAPEQTGRTGMSVDERADLYALGSTFYEMVTGRQVFDSSDPLGMVYDTLTRTPAPPIDVDAGLPRQLSDIVMRLLEKEPGRRYQSADGLEHDLRRLREKLAAGESGSFPLGERDFPVRLLAPSRLVGRRTEVRALRAAFETAVAGGSRGVLVAGAPGVGKTSLVNELRPVAATANGWFVAGKFDQYRHDTESSAVLQVLGALGRLILAGSELDLAAIRPRIEAALGANGALAAAVPEFAALLGTATESPTESAGGAIIDAKQLYQAGLNMLTAVASPSRPVVIVVDDLQWASSLAIGFIDAVLTDERLTGVLLVGAYRSDEVDAAHPLAGALARWLRLGATSAPLVLDNLPPAGLGELLTDMLRLPPREATVLAEVIGARTGGNPFDTVELVNALRRDGALVPGPTGWGWDANAIRRFVGHGDVLDLLVARIDRLPGPARELVDLMACLGGDVDVELLRTAGGRQPMEIDDQLVAPLEDGLLVLDQGATKAVRFRHDRVQQAAHLRLTPDRRRALQLSLARRLAADPGGTATAAEQYLQCVDQLRDPAERRVAAGLFVKAAAAVQVVNQAAAERYLAAVTTALSGIQTEADSPLLAVAERLRHAVLYGLGRLAEADDVYADIERRNTGALDLAASAQLQISSLTNRGRPREAVDLGLALLRRLGLEVPESESDFEADLQRGFAELAIWAEGLDLANDLARPETADPRAERMGNLIIVISPAAQFSGAVIINAWILLPKQRLWIDYGASDSFVAGLGGGGASAITVADDYRTGYLIGRHAIQVGEARHYEHGTSYARHTFSLMSQHWFQPLEDDVYQAHRAREGLVRDGNLQMACFSFFTSLAAQFDCAPTLETCAAEAESALAFSTRTGNNHGSWTFLVYRQAVRALRGETATPGNFTDASYDEAEFVRTLGTNVVPATYFHVYRALTAALFGDAPSLIAHSAAAMPLLHSIAGQYPVALAHLLRGLALAAQIREAETADRGGLLAELSSIDAWLTARAADAPVNFGHLAALLAAERAWAVGDAWTAALAFDVARGRASAHRPWHSALITERAALFHLANGFEQTGRELMTTAKALYIAWCASGKVRQLDAEHAFLRATNATRPVGSNQYRGRRESSIMSVDDIDMVALLHASQALSSETSLARLRAHLGKLLGEMTGATAVRIALRAEESDEWLLWDTTGTTADGVAVTDAAAGLLPMSAFRYVERTGEPLLVQDATQDDRFARDPYLIGLERLSLLAVPVRSQGFLRAVLLVENNRRAGAFAADRLGAVQLVTGQLAVSLDNALLYASLERKVAERTAALDRANQQLEALSNTDALTGLPNRRHFDTTLDAERRRAASRGTSLGLAMIDVDNFKLYNDRHGHVAGDRCLRLVAECLASSLRGGTDLLFRYGGEEFAVILPGADPDRSAMIGERLCRAVAARREPHAGSEAGIVSVSIGVAACRQGSTSTGDELIAAADAALYEAKRNGRNQVRSAAGPAPTTARFTRPG